MNETINIKRRKTPTARREGKLVRLVDTIQRLTNIKYEKDYWIFGDQHDDGRINPKYLAEIQEIHNELRTFDITDIGHLYLTSGGRIVLDKGYGESFDDSDTVLFTLDELITGMSAEDFISKVMRVMSKSD